MRTPMPAFIIMFGSLIGPGAAGALPVDAPDLGPSAARGGMESPAAAVEELLTSLRASDPLGVLAVLHPEERFLIDTLYTNATRSAEVVGAIDVESLLRALRVDVTTEALAVEQRDDRVAWVTTRSARVTASLDVAQMDAAVTADLSEWDQPDPYDRSFDLQEEEIGIAVVSEGGRWFVSAFYTAAELARRGLDLPSQLSPAAAAPASAAATPEAAIIALTSAVSAKDLNATASALTPFEGRLITDYQSTIGGELLADLHAYTVTVAPTQVHVVEQTADWAIVEVDRWRFGASGAEDDFGEKVEFVLSVDGLCAELHSWDNGDEAYEDSKGCAFADDSVFNAFEALPEAGWSGPRFVVVNRGGTWSVSLLQTVLQHLAPLTIDIDTLAGAVELAGSVLMGVSDGFYSAAISFLAAAEPVLGHGTSTVAPRGGGEYGVFRVPGGVIVELDLPPGEHDDGACFAVVLDEDRGEFAGGFGCDGQSDPIPAPATILVTTSWEMAFATIAEIGPFDVTVTPA